MNPESFDFTNVRYLFAQAVHIFIHFDFSRMSFAFTACTLILRRSNFFKSMHELLYQFLVQDTFHGIHDLSITKISSYSLHQAHFHRVYIEPSKLSKLSSQFYKIQFRLSRISIEISCKPNVRVFRLVHKQNLLHLLCCLFQLATSSSSNPTVEIKMTIQ